LRVACECGVDIFGLCPSLRFLMCPLSHSTPASGPIGLGTLHEQGSVLVWLQYIHLVPLQESKHFIHALHSSAESPVELPVHGSPSTREAEMPTSTREADECIGAVWLLDGGPTTTGTEFFCVFFLDLFTSLGCWPFSTHCPPPLPPAAGGALPATCAWLVSN
jgi:hypothetical protein